MATPFGVRAEAFAVKLPPVDRNKGPDPFGARPWFYETMNRAVTRDIRLTI